MMMATKTGASPNGATTKCAVVAALGGFLFGFDTAVIAGTTKDLTLAYSLTPAFLGWTVSSALWGTIIGAMTACGPGDKYGRRDSLRVMAVLYVISALGCALAWNWTSLVLFRFIGGIGIGGSSVLGPMYIAEIAPTKWRGRLVGLFQFNVVFGILLAYFSNYIIGLMRFGVSEWRWMLGVAGLPAALFLLMLFGIPRSPRWLVKKGRIDEARRVLQLTGEEEYEKELQEIVDSIDAEHGHADEPLFSKKYRLPIFLAVSIGLFNQLSGINAILYYLNDIFADAGFSKVSGNLQAVAIGATNHFAVHDAGHVDHRSSGPEDTSADRFGGYRSLPRRRSRDLSQWLAQESAGVPARRLHCFLCVFSGSRDLGLHQRGVPQPSQSEGQSLGSFSHWFANALISGIFPLMAAKSGGIPFVFFALMMVAQFFVVLTIYPETKGVSLEEMQRKMAIR